MLYGSYLETAAPAQGRTLEELRQFLARMDLRYDDGVEFTALLRDGEGQILATASLQGGVVKCVAVDPAQQGEGLTATVLTAVRREALARGQRHLFLYTKPGNLAQFAGLGFSAVAKTDRVLLMEDQRGGFDAWADGVACPGAEAPVGAVVMNCNPMTLGHRYLLETAAAQCGHLYVLVVSEDKSAVPAEDRLALVRAAAADLHNVSVAETGRYLISSATFPDYFLKDRGQASAVWADLDAAVFCRLAAKLGIPRRFVGSEPFCPVTAAYNRCLAEVLPAHGVELTELPRLEREGTAVSATAVRELVRQGRWQETRSLVPEATFAYLSREENREKILGRMAEGAQK